MPTLIEVLVSWFPMLLLIGVWIYFMRRGGFGKYQTTALDEMKRQNQLLADILDRMDKRLTLLEEERRRERG